MKTKKRSEKQAVKKAVEKDSWGFRKGSKSSQAVKLLASGKVTLPAVRSKFKTLSFSKLLQALGKNGFKVVKEGEKGLCSITTKGRVRRRAIETTPPGPGPSETTSPGSSL